MVDARTLIVLGVVLNVISWALLTPELIGIEKMTKATSAVQGRLERTGTRLNAVSREIADRWLVSAEGSVLSALLLAALIASVVLILSGQWLPGIAGGFVAGFLWGFAAAIFVVWSILSRVVSGLGNMLRPAEDPSEPPVRRLSGARRFADLAVLGPGRVLLLFLGPLAVFAALSVRALPLLVLSGALSVGLRMLGGEARQRAFWVMVAAACFLLGNGFNVVAAFVAD